MEDTLPSRETIFVSNGSFGRRGGLERKRDGGINIPRLRIVADVAGKPREASKWWRRNTRTPDSFGVRAQCEPRSARVFVQPARKKAAGEFFRARTRGGEFEPDHPLCLRS